MKEFLQNWPKRPLGLEDDLIRGSTLFHMCCPASCVLICLQYMTHCLQGLSCSVSPSNEHQADHLEFSEDVIQGLVCSLKQLLSLN